MAIRTASGVATTDQLVPPKSSMFSAPLAHRVADGPVGGGDRLALDQDLGQGPAALAGPGGEGGDELVLVDQADLEGQ
jgi:hypothetical protein